MRETDGGSEGERRRGVAGGKREGVEGIGEIFAAPLRHARKRSIRSGPPDQVLERKGGGNGRCLRGGETQSRIPVTVGHQRDARRDRKRPVEDGLGSLLHASHHTDEHRLLNVIDRVKETDVGRRGLRRDYERVDSIGLSRRG